MPDARTRFLLCRDSRFLTLFIMSRSGVACGVLLFAAGLGLGSWISRPAGPLPLRSVDGDDTRPGPKAKPPSWRELVEGVKVLRKAWDSHHPGDGGDLAGGAWRQGWRARTREEALALLGSAFESGDAWKIREALRDVEHAEGDPLGSEALDELSGHLASADRDVLRDLARTLVVAGGPEGLARVMGFLEDPGQSIERRRQALDGLTGIPPEKAAEVIPALAAYLETSPPMDLERSAAFGIGRLGGEKGVETLLGILGARPSIRAEAIFDAIGEVGIPADAKAVLGLLGGDWTPGAKASLLRSAARLAARGGDGSDLLGLLREPPAGMSREMVARAIGDASRDMGTAFLFDALRETAGDRRAQEAIARAMLWSGGKEGLDALVKAARDPELGLDALDLARALNDFQGAAAVPLMMELFRSSRDEEVLEPLARGLARNAGKESMESLLEILETGGDPWQRRALARALEDGSSAALGADRILSLLRAEKDQDVALSLARTITRLHPEAIEGREAELFRGAASPVERVAYAQMLERLGSPGAIEILGEQLRVETDSKAQWEMARILGRSGAEGIDELAHSLQEASDERSRHSLLWGLEASRRPVGPEARSLFISMAGRDPAPSIRGQAAEILGRQQDPALIPVLSGLLASEQSREVRQRIERAIRELDGRR